MKSILNFLKNIIGEKILMLMLNTWLTEDNIKKGLDEALDFLENLAEKTKTKADDEALRRIRKILDIPEFDEKK